MLITGDDKIWAISWWCDPIDKTTQSRPIWVGRKLLRWYWYDWDTWTTFYSDMTETPSFPLTLISLTHLGPTLHRYDCDTQSPMSTFMTATLFTFDTLMTETPLLDLAHIWLRRQKYFLWFISWHRYDCDGQNTYRTYFSDRIDYFIIEFSFIPNPRSNSFKYFLFYNVIPPVSDQLS